MVQQITVRVGEPEHAGDSVIIHMGAGDAQLLAQTIVQNYDDFRPLAEAISPGRSGARGLLGVSVYGLVNGVTETEVLGAMPHGKYGTAQFSEIAGAYQVVPTVVTKDGQSDAVVALQRAHFTLVLPHPDVALPDSMAVSEAPDEIIDTFLLAVASELEVRLLPLLAPRITKNS